MSALKAAWNAALDRIEIWHAKRVPHSPPHACGTTTKRIGAQS